jgi:hypothetical protein
VCSTRFWVLCRLSVFRVVTCQPRQMPVSSFKGPGNEAVNRIAQITQSQPGFGLLFGLGWHHNQSRLVR